MMVDCAMRIRDASDDGESPLEPPPGVPVPDGPAVVYKVVVDKGVEGVEGVEGDGRDEPDPPAVDDNCANPIDGGVAR
jgi:hypothetical protein